VEDPCITVELSKRCIAKKASAGAKSVRRSICPQRVHGGEDQRLGDEVLAQEQQGDEDGLCARGVQGDEDLAQEPRQRTPRRRSSGRGPPRLAQAPHHDTRCPGVGHGDGGGAARQHGAVDRGLRVGEEKKTGREENGGQEASWTGEKGEYIF
jgi:hypothetical protein